MIDVIILTSGNYGLAAHHLPYLLNSNHINVKAVVVSKGEITNKNRFYKNKLKKAWQIGLLGTLNGFRIRTWFSTDVDDFLEISSLKTQCLNCNIPYYAVSSVNSEETMAVFKNAHAAVGLSLGNGYIPKKIFSIPQYGMINIHHEQLPQYQNAQSVIWQLYSGSVNSGYTIHIINAKIDSGSIIYQEQIPIIFEETLRKTVSQTIIKLQKASALGLVKVLENFEDYYNNAKPQDKGNYYTTPSIWQFFKILKQYKKLKNTIS